MNFVQKFRRAENAPLPGERIRRKGEKGRMSRTYGQHWLKKEVETMGAGI